MPEVYQFNKMRLWRIFDTRSSNFVLDLHDPTKTGIEVTPGHGEWTMREVMQFCPMRYTGRALPRYLPNLSGDNAYEQVCTRITDKFYRARVWNIFHTLSMKFTNRHRMPVSDQKKASCFSMLEIRHQWGREFNMILWVPSLELQNAIRRAKVQFKVTAA